MYSSTSCYCSWNIFSNDHSENVTAAVSSVELRSSIIAHIVLPTQLSSSLIRHSVVTYRERFEDEWSGAQVYFFRHLIKILISVPQTSTNTSSYPALLYIPQSFVMECARTMFFSFSGSDSIPCGYPMKRWQPRFTVRTLDSSSIILGSRRQKALWLLAR